jgi:hypothetical protein
MTEGGEEEGKDEFVLTIERNNGKTTIIGVGGTSAEKYGMLTGVVLTGGNEDDVTKFNEAKKKLSSVAVGETVAEERKSETGRPIDIEEKRIEEKATVETAEQNDFTIANGIIKKIRNINIKDDAGNLNETQEVIDEFNKIKNEIYKYYNAGSNKYSENKKNLFEKLITNIMAITTNIHYKINQRSAYTKHLTEEMTNDTIKLLESILDEMFNEQGTKIGGSRNNKTQKRRRNQRQRKGGKSRRNVHKK